MRSAHSAALGIVLATLLLTPVMAGAAAQRMAKPNPEAELRKLTREASSLNKSYRGEVQSLEDTRVQASKAAETAKGLRRDLATAKTDIVRFAQTSYMGVPLDGANLLSFQGDASLALNQAALMSYLTGQRATRLNRIQELIKKAEDAEKAAEGKIEDLKKDIAKLKQDRVRIEKLLAKYSYQAPTSSDGLTARMVNVRNTILQNFPMPYAVGCLRVGDPGEHGSGRACDFMMSTGGRMPTPEAKARGDRLAQWAIDHGRELGIMYIIWQQRYYDIRTGAGWRMMSDRGGITANHYDHVHVSVF
ncbi:coiled-coil domain-containing protein [Streptosporangium sp. NPDC000396]|uniref:coiled-coil domain-containing protein n=1 Tax=Streptosporangium sp. NPDC000396 TaxID=3366185 RepID=UPI003678DD17